MEQNHHTLTSSEIGDLKKVLIREDKKARHNKYEEFNASHELDGGIKDYWEYYGRPNPDDEQYYENTFYELFGKDFSFNRWAKERYEAGKSVNALNLMGPPDLITDSNFLDKELSVTLLKPYSHNSEKSKDEDERSKREYLTSKDIVNVYSKRTRNGIERYMTSHQIAGFDLVYCRPFGPFRHLTQSDHRFERKHTTSYAALYYSLLSWGYDVLSSDEGLLITQIPSLAILSSDKKYNHILQIVVASLQERGVDVSFNIPPQEVEMAGLKIIKQNDSPKNLPSVREMRDILIQKRMIFDNTSFSAQSVLKHLFRTEK